MSLSKEKYSLPFETQKNIDAWLNDNIAIPIKKEIEKLLHENPAALEDAFYKRIAFGTAGMRGLMGIGTNRMNEYTIQIAAEGLANYINQQPAKGDCHKVLINYDSRHHSYEFAEITARVLAAHEIEAYLFREMRPIALVSFGCRFLGCTAAVMITASHNPKEYNGFKVWWSDGGQVVPPNDEGIIQEVNKITHISSIKKTTTINSPFIKKVGYEIDQEYLDAIRPLQNNPENNKKRGNNLQIVYTSLHGTGITIIPKMLQDWGFTNVTIVEPQAFPDGDFPTVQSPNPEYPETLKMAIDRLLKINGDLLIGTDPDADRLGFGIRIDSRVILFTGNQIACLLLNHVCKGLVRNRLMPENAGFIKSVVTTELFKAIAKRYSKECADVLIGFKYIAELIRKWEQETHGKQFIFGAEESFGFLRGTHCRDKDAVVCSGLLCELAWEAKQEGKTVRDVLFEIYRQNGIYREKLVSINFADTKEGYETMTHAMNKLRNFPQKTVNNMPIAAIEDYLMGIKTNLKSGEIFVLDQPKSDLLIYCLENGSRVMIRPSGTEPKVKLYCDILETNYTTLAEGIASADEKASTLLNSIEKSFIKEK